MPSQSGDDITRERTEMLTRLFCCIIAMVFLTLSPHARADDGYALWLHYPKAEGTRLSAFSQHAGTILAPGTSPTATVARAELARGLLGMTGRTPAAVTTPQDGTLWLATPAESPELAKLPLDLGALGQEGYAIRSLQLGGKAVTVIAANSDQGLLYGAFHFLRLAQTASSLDTLDIRSAPRTGLRMLNHWDNLDGSVERGYAGQSIWDWWRGADWKGPRYTDYARANASIGINGTVLNNVNAKADSLTAPYIAKAAALADVFRPYGIRVYLSACCIAYFQSITKRPLPAGSRAPEHPLDWYKTLRFPYAPGHP